MLRPVPEIEAGNTVKIRLTFTVSDGGPAVTALSVRVRDNSGTEVAAGSVTSPATNTFLATYVLPDGAIGRYIWRWESTAGSNVKGEAAFDVIGSGYTAP